MNNKINKLPNGDFEVMKDYIRIKTEKGEVKLNAHDVFLLIKELDGVEGVKFLLSCDNVKPTIEVID